METETMKTWIKRTLIGLAAGTLLFGGLAAAWAHRHAQHHFGWRAVSEADVAGIKGTVIERVGSKLDLDACWPTACAKAATPWWPAATTPSWSCRP
jgi:hypothetical protein